MAKTIQQKGRIVYVEPNNLADTQYGIQINNGNNLTWKPEDLTYSVDLQVIIPNRDTCGDAKDDNVVFNITGPSFYTSFMSGSIVDEANPTEQNFLSDNYTDISYQEIRNNNAGSKEALGIQSIDISFDPYFFPKVTMKMIDVRGASLMMPYEENYIRALDKRKDTCEHFFNAVFHFPSPRFALSVKGFYGTRVTFMLSVTSFNGSFNSQTGNFEVTIEFIGHMYGVYSDIPFNYLLVAPYIGSTDGNVNNYWKTQTTSPDGHFKYSDGKPIKTFIEFLRDYDNIAEQYGAISGKYDGVTKVTDLIDEKEIDEALKNAYDNVINETVKYKNGDILVYSATTSNKVEICFLSAGSDVKFEETTVETALKDYEKKYNAYKESEFYKILSLPDEFGKKDGNPQWPLTVTYGTMTEGFPKDINIPSSIKNDKEKRYRYTLYTLDKKNYNKLVTRINKIDQERQAKVNALSYSDEMKNFSGELLNGFTPTVENTYRMIFAHLDTFMTLYYGVLDNIKKDNKRKDLTYYKIKSESTDIGVKTEDCFLPPYTAYFNKKERIYPVQYNPALSELDEVKFIEQIYDGILGVNWKISQSERRKMITGGDTYIETPDIVSFNPYIPISIIDVYNGLNKNPYSAWSPRDTTTAFRDLVNIFCARILSAGAINGDIINASSSLLNKDVMKAEAKNAYNVYGKELNSYSDFVTKLAGMSSEKFDFNGEIKGYIDAINSNEKDNVTGFKFNIGEYNNDEYVCLSNDYINNCDLMPIKFSNDESGREIYESIKGFKVLTDYNFKANKKAIDEVFGVDKGHMRFYYGATEMTPSAFNGPLLKSESTIPTNGGYKKADLEKDVYWNKLNKDTQQLVKNKKDDEIIPCIYIPEGTGISKRAFDAIYESYNGGDNNGDNSLQVLLTNEEKLHLNKRNKPDGAVVYNGMKNIPVDELTKSDVTEDEVNLEAFNFLGMLQYTPYVYGFSDCGYALDVIGKLQLQTVSASAGGSASNIYYEETLKGCNKTNEILLMPKSMVLFLGALSWFYKKYGTTDDKRNEIALDRRGLFSPEKNFKCNSVGDYFKYTNSKEYWKKIKEILENESEKDEDNLLNYFTNWAKNDFIRIAKSIKENYSKCTQNKLLLSGFFNGFYDFYDPSNTITKELLGYYETLIPVMRVSQFSQLSRIKIRDIRAFLQSLYTLIYNGGQEKEEEKEDIEDEKKELIEENNRRQKKDLETKTAMYYTLKTIYDKWIPTYCVDRFKLNTFEEDKEITMKRAKGGELVYNKINEYNSFVYKDSFYKNIGDKFIIDPNELYKQIKNHYQKGENASTIEFLSSVAYNNKLLFMPLPVLTEIYDANSMAEIFTPHRIYDSADYVNSRGFGTTYVLMYTHEPSKNLDVKVYEHDIGMENDGIDIADSIGNILPDAVTITSEDDEYADGGKDDISNNYNIPAFGVTFAKQNQTYFKNITLNMEGGRTTDYAIMNTLVLANEEGNGDVNAPRTKAQNMYPIFANRVYDCTVEMMGCMNIMPTMLFQLNNVPMFRGAYRITNVSHHIEPGSMTTRFVGTRISKKTIPFNYDIIDIEELIDRIKNMTLEDEGGVVHISSNDGNDYTIQDSSNWFEHIEKMGKWYETNIHTYQSCSYAKDSTPRKRLKYECPLIGGDTVEDDCSGFVKACLVFFASTSDSRDGLKAIRKVYTCTETMQPDFVTRKDNFHQVLTKNGFMYLEYTSADDLQKGDIICGSAKTHTEIYVGKNSKGKDMVYSWGYIHDKRIIEGEHHAGMPCKMEYLNGRGGYKHVWRYTGKSS